jgi:hypothetical protein
LQETEGEYLGRLVKQQVEARARLKAGVREARSLRDHIKVAAEHGDLDSTSFEQVKVKMEALNEFYDEACRELDELPEKLLDPRSPHWWSVAVSSSRSSPRA